MNFATFNALLEDFLSELLVQQFNGNPDIVTLRTAMAAVKFVDESRPARVFVQALAPHADLVAAKDPALFENLQIGEVDFAALWHSAPSDQARAAIFDHIHSLFLVGTHLLHQQ